MGTHAERVAIKDHVSREDQDAFALGEPPEGDRRHRRRPLRRRDGARHRPRRQGPRDGRHGRRRPAPRLDGRGARAPQAGLRAARRRGSRRRDDRDRHRRATRPGITDGAAATVVASERAVERLGLKPLARIVGYAQAEVAPEVAVPRAGRGRPPAARPDRAADRGVRPHRDQRGVRRADARRRPRARVRLGQGQRQRRRDRARPPDRRERRADRRDAPP